MVLRKVQAALYNAVVVHLYKIAFADLLIVGYESLTMGAGYFQDMAATYFFAIWVLYFMHNSIVPKLNGFVNANTFNRQRQYTQLFSKIYAFFIIFFKNVLTFWLR